MTNEFLNKLKAWIAAGTVHNFYVTPEWRSKSAEVLRLDKAECQICRQRGRYKRADLVHHVNHVKKRPELALDLFYRTEDGEQKRNLISVCKECHEHECHPERLRHRSTRPKFDNSERWD